MSPFTEISFEEGIINKKKIGRGKEPILGYVPKNDEKKNLHHKGLKQFLYWSPF